MTFEESISVIKKNMREGDLKLVADTIGCTKPVVVNALTKTSLEDMTATEKRAFECLLDMLSARAEKEEKTINKAISLAESLSK